MELKSRKFLILISLALFVLLINGCVPPGKGIQEEKVQPVQQQEIAPTIEEIPEETEEQQVQELPTRGRPRRQPLQPPLRKPRMQITDQKSIEQPETAQSEIDPASFSKEVEYKDGFTGYLCKPQGTGPFPLVVYNHGGLGTQIGGAPEETCESLMKEGYVGFSPLRRQTVSLEGHIDDVYAGLDYAKNLDYVDTNRIGILGFSRGGLLTFIAAIERSDFKAVVLMAPAPAQNTLESYLDDAGKVSAPVFILVSENDLVQANHVQLANDVNNALKSAGKEVEFKMYPPYGSDGHMMFFEIGAYWTDVVAFLKKNL